LRAAITGGTRQRRFFLCKNDFDRDLCTTCSFSRIAQIQSGLSTRCRERLRLAGTDELKRVRGNNFELVWVNATLRYYDGVITMVLLASSRVAKVKPFQVSATRMRRPSVSDRLDYAAEVLVWGKPRTVGTPIVCFQNLPQLQHDVIWHSFPSVHVCGNLVKHPRVTSTAQ
jgi:hypothetical protein